MTFDVEWQRGDTDDLIITLTADGAAMDLSGYSKISMCVTTLKEPPDATTLLWKQEATILDQVSLTGKISVPMAANADEAVDTVFYFDIQGITTVGSKVKTLIPNGLIIYRQDKNKDTS